MRSLFLGIGAVVVTLVVTTTAAQIPSGYRAIAHAERVPAHVLYAIACAESGRAMPDGRTLPWPWTLNVAGDAHYFSSRSAAYAALSRVLENSTHVDVGIGQINWRWHGDRFPDAWSALDPYRNLQVAAQVLREQFERCQCEDWWIAVEHYHAPSDTEKASDRRSRYRGHVERCWQSVNA